MALEAYSWPGSFPEPFEAARRIAESAPDDQVGLVATLGVGRKRKGAQPPPGTETPPAPVPAEKPHAARRNRIVAFVVKARGTLSAALDRPEVVSMLEPFGYMRDSIAGLLARVQALSVKELEHEELKRQLVAATQTMNGATAEFRD